MSAAAIPLPRPSRPKVPRKHVPRPRLASLRSPGPGLPTLIAPPTASPQPRTRISITCPNTLCPSPNVVAEDHGLVCHTCGTVVEEDAQIVSDLTFGETSSGAAAVQGQYIGANQTHARPAAGRGQRPGFGAGAGDGTSSREMTERNARIAITAFATALLVPMNLVDPALQIFKLSLEKNFIQGRSIRSVAAVALYIACRRQPSTNTLMLIDLAEHLQTNVFAMGQTYAKIVQRIWGNVDSFGNWDGSMSDKGRIDPINPENLIYRFAKELEFGDKLRDVSHDAVDLVRRMDRDWMTTGRRPAGICGAALLLAARMNNFRRTVREVVFVVKVCEITVNKRLEEFMFTDSGNLTVEEFRNVRLESQCDPPAFYRARQEKKRGKRGRKRKAAPETAAEIEGSESEEIGDEVRAVADARAAKRGRVDKDGFAIPDIPIDPALRDAGASVTISARSEDGQIDEALTSAVNSALSEIEDQESQYRGHPPPSIDELPEIADSEMTPSASESAPPKRRGRPKGAKNWQAPPPSAAELALEAEIEGDMREILDGSLQSLDPRLSSSSAHTETQSTNPPSSTENAHASEPPQPAPNPLTAGNLSRAPLSPTIQPDEFDDDPEVSTCLLTPAEIEIKERIWVAENAEWLRNDHAKKIRRELATAAALAAGIDPNANQGKKRRKRRGRIGDVSYLDKNKENGKGGEQRDERERTSRSASEAMKGMLEQRGFSKRLNYDVMNQLFPEENEVSREGSVESRRSLSYAEHRREEREKRARSGGARRSSTRERSASGGTGSSPPRAVESITHAEAPILSPSPSRMSPELVQHRPTTSTSGPNLPTPNDTQAQTQGQTDSPSVQPPLQPQRPATEIEGEEEAIGEISDTDSPLSSLPSSSAQAPVRKSPLIPTAMGGGFENADDDDDESEGDPDDYVNDEDDDEVEAALEGRFQRRVSLGDGEEEDDEGEEV